MAVKFGMQESTISPRQISSTLVQHVTPVGQKTSKSPPLTEINIVAWLALSTMLVVITLRCSVYFYLVLKSNDVK